MFKVSLFENALDELQTAYKYLEIFQLERENETITDKEKIFAIKHTIKHLSASWELLMKYRIQLHEPKRIFLEPEKLTKEKFKSGDFRTIGYESAMKILKEYNILEDEETRRKKKKESEFANLKRLHKYRNQIEHCQINVSFEQIIQTVFKAIYELVWFCEVYVIATIENRTVMYQMGDIVIQLYGVQKELEMMVAKGVFVD